MVIAEMDIRKEILLAVAGTDYYPVVIQVIDDVERLRDRLGYLGELPFFECHGLFVLVNEAFGKNVFFLMILTGFLVLLKNVVLKRRKGTFYFVPFIYSFCLFSYIFYLIEKACI